MSRDVSAPADRLVAVEDVPKSGAPRARRKGQASQHARDAFFEQLIRLGDPALAADAVGLPLMPLFRQRDADPRFAASWQSALGYAWERLESRVLAELLARTDAPAEAGSGRKAGGALTGLLDSRLALAIIDRRERPVTRHHGRPVESASVARLRAELRDLAGEAARRTRAKAA